MAELIINLNKQNELKVEKLIEANLSFLIIVGIYRYKDVVGFG